MKKAIDNRSPGELLLEDMVEEIIQDAEGLKQIYLGGLDEACIGIITDTVDGKNRLVYDRGLCVQCFVENDGMTRDEVEEWFAYNTIRALPYMEGDERYAPVIISRIDTKAIRKANGKKLQRY